MIQVKAIDNDVGPNAAVLYRLKQDTVGNYRSFAIDQVTGLITVKQPLDRERQKIYDVSFVAIFVDFSAHSFLKIFYQSIRFVGSR